MPLQLTTILARNPAVLERQIRHVVDKYAKQNLTCLFALTANDSVDWTRSWQLVRSINESQTVGCLSSSFTGVHTAKRDLSRYLGCSIGVFEPSEAVCFRSTIAGDRQPQVGRWHSFRKIEEAEPWPLSGNVSWDDVWGRKEDQSGAPTIDIGDTRPEDIHSLVYFTDRAYQGLSRSLSQTFPLTSRVGLIATPTLTLTELPATLLHQDSVYSTGAVGLALKRQYETRTQFQNLQQISGPMTVGSSQGNIIHALNGDSNPTQVLLRILEKTPGTTASNPAAFRFLKERVFVGEVGPDGKVYRMLHITSGDPSRGGLALSSEVAPAPGAAFSENSKSVPLKSRIRKRPRFPSVEVGDAPLESSSSRKRRKGTRSTDIMKAPMHPSTAESRLAEESEHNPPSLFDSELPPSEPRRRRRNVGGEPRRPLNGAKHERSPSLPPATSLSSQRVTSASGPVRATHVEPTDVHRSAEIPKEKSMKGDAFTLPVSVAEAHLEGVASFTFSPDPNLVGIKRKVMRLTYGGSDRTLTQYGKPEKNPSSNTRRQMVWPMPDDHPAMPHAPGQPGLMFAARVELRAGVWSVFTRNGNKKCAEWTYLGEYENTFVGTMTKEQFIWQSENVKRSWIKRVATKKTESYSAMRTRIEAKKGGPITEGDIRKAFENGDEGVSILRMRCVGYDRTFIEHVYRCHQPPLENERKGTVVLGSKEVSSRTAAASATTRPRRVGVAVATGSALPSRSPQKAVTHRAIRFRRAVTASSPLSSTILSLPQAHIPYDLMNGHYATVTTLQAEVSRKSLENEILNRQLARLTADVEDLKEDKRSYRASKDRAEADLDALRSDLENANLEIDQLRGELEKERKESAYLRKKMEEESQQDRKWFVMVERLQAKVTELEAQRETCSSPPNSEMSVERELSRVDTVIYETRGVQSEPGPSWVSPAPAYSSVSTQTLELATASPPVNLEDERMAVDESPPHIPTPPPNVVNVETQQDHQQEPGPSATPTRAHSEVIRAPPTPVTPLRIRIPSAAGLGRIKRNNGLNGDYWTCFATPERDERFMPRSEFGSNKSSPGFRKIARPLKRPCSEPMPVSNGIPKRSASNRNRCGRPLNSNSGGTWNSRSPNCKRRSLTCKHDKRSFRTTNDRLNKELDRVNEELERERKAKEEAFRALEVERKGIKDLKERLKRLEDLSNTGPRNPTEKVKKEEQAPSVQLQVENTKHVAKPDLKVQSAGGSSPLSTPATERNVMQSVKRERSPSIELIDLGTFSANPKGQMGEAAEQDAVFQQENVKLQNRPASNHVGSSNAIQPVYPPSPKGSPAPKETPRQRVKLGRRIRRAYLGKGSSTSSGATPTRRSVTVDTLTGEDPETTEGDSPPSSTTESDHSPSPVASPEPKQSSTSGPSKGKQQRAFKPSQALVLPANIVDSYRGVAPPLYNVGISSRHPPEAFSISRAMMSKFYGGSLNVPFQIIPALKEKGLPRIAFYAKPETNSCLPTVPGETGLLLGCEELTGGKWGGLKWSVFVRSQEKTDGAEWMYVGDYECEEVGTMAKEQFCAQNEKVQQRWVEHVWGKKDDCYLEMKLRILLRKEGQSQVEYYEARQNLRDKLLKQLKDGTKEPPTGDDILQAYRNGEELIPIARLKCKWYDSTFINTVKKAKVDELARIEDEKKAYDERLKKTEEWKAERLVAGNPVPKQTARKSCAKPPKSVRAPSVKQRMQEQAAAIAREQAENAKGSQWKGWDWAGHVENHISATTPLLRLLLLPSSMDANDGVLKQLKLNLEKIKALTAQVAQLQDENADLKHDKTSFRATNDRLNRELDRVNGELEKAKEEVESERKAREDAVRALDLERRGVSDLKERLKRLEDSLAKESRESTVKLEVKEEEQIHPIRIEEEGPRTQDTKKGSPTVTTGNEPIITHLHKRKRVPSVEIIDVEAFTANLETPDTAIRGTSGLQSSSQEGNSSGRISDADVHEEPPKATDPVSLCNGEDPSTRDVGAGSRPTKDPAAATVTVTGLQSPTLNLVSPSVKVLGKRKAVEVHDGHPGPLLKKGNPADLAARTKSQVPLSISQLDLPSLPTRAGRTPWSSRRRLKHTLHGTLPESDRILLFGPRNQESPAAPSSAYGESSTSHAARSRQRVTLDALEDDDPDTPQSDSSSSSSTESDYVPSRAASPNFRISKQVAIYDASQRRGSKALQALTLPGPTVLRYCRGDGGSMDFSPTPESFSISRAMMSKLYGGSSNTPFQRILPFEENESQRIAFYARPETNSCLPKVPGETGLLIGCEELTGGKWGGSKWSVFVRAPEKDVAEWVYRGEYECQEVGRMTKEDFGAQREEARQRWVETVWAKKDDCYLEVKIRILLRKEERPVEELRKNDPKLWERLRKELKDGTRDPPTGDDIMKAYRNGDESIPISRLKCVGYDHAFISAVGKAKTDELARVEREEREYEEKLRKNEEERAKLRAAGLRVPKQTARKSCAKPPKNLRKPSVKKRMQEQAAAIAREQAENSRALGGANSFVRRRMAPPIGDGGGDSDGGLSYVSEEDLPRRRLVCEDCAAFSRKEDLHKPGSTVYIIVQPVSIVQLVGVCLVSSVIIQRRDRSFCVITTDASRDSPLPHVVHAMPSTHPDSTPNRKSSSSCSCTHFSEAKALTKQIAQLKDEIEELKRDKRSFRDASDELRWSLVKAREESKEMRRRLEVERAEKERLEEMVKEREEDSTTTSSSTLPGSSVKGRPSLEHGGQPEAIVTVSESPSVEMTNPPSPKPLTGKQQDVSSIKRKPSGQPIPLPSKKARSSSTDTASSSSIEAATTASTSSSTSTNTPQLPPALPHRLAGHASRSSSSSESVADPRVAARQAQSAKNSSRPRPSPTLYSIPVVHSTREEHEPRASDGDTRGREEAPPTFDALETFAFGQPSLLDRVSMNSQGNGTRPTSPNKGSHTRTEPNGRNVSHTRYRLVLQVSSGRGHVEKSVDSPSPVQLRSDPISELHHFWLSLPTSMSAFLSVIPKASCSCSASHENEALKKRVDRLAEEVEELRRDKRSFRDASDEARRTLARTREELVYLRKKVDMEKDEKEKLMARLKEVQAGVSVAKPTSGSGAVVHHTTARNTHGEPPNAYPSPVEPDRALQREEERPSEETSQVSSTALGKRKTPEDAVYPNKKTTLDVSEPRR
ncbi:hypothetical protein NMY22_g5266 [Coprinellus aureogranulatus]|nr:hypothetical protein NMY22_g5266 [Coprinellus aureogranulatus]